MAKRGRIVYTRGGAAETPNWSFGLRVDLPRADVPELCEGLDFIAREKRGGSYFYPDYKNDKIGAAFEWYLPYRGWPFGYKVGVEFWIEDGDLHQLRAYVLYGPDHPRKGLQPTFDKSEEVKFQRKIIHALETATHWRTKLPPKQFLTVHYLEVPHYTAIRQALEIPPLRAYILPTVQMGKAGTPVSAVIQVIMARFREEAKSLASQAFTKLLALLTLATGSHYEGYRSQLGRTPLKRFVSSISPMPDVRAIYPTGKFKMRLDEASELPLGGALRAARCYGSLAESARSRFDESLFAYYTAEDLMKKKFPTLAAVTLIAALKPFRGVSKCDGTVSCSKCGALQLRHDLRGEASGIATSLEDLFGLPKDDGRRRNLQKTVKAVYQSQRSSFVHDAIFRHGEFGPSHPEAFPSKTSAISEELVRRNQLSTVRFLTRRALLQHLHGLASECFDPSVYGIEAEKFEARLASMGLYVVGSKYRTGVRAMGGI